MSPTKNWSMLTPSSSVRMGSVERHQIDIEPEFPQSGGDSVVPHATAPVDACGTGGEADDLGGSGFGDSLGRSPTLATAAEWEDIDKNGAATPLSLRQTQTRV